jgi:hypothetical protein
MSQMFQCLFRGRIIKPLNNPPKTKPLAYSKNRDKKKINSLLEKGAFELTHLLNVPKGLWIFNLQFVNEIKHPGTKQAYKKSWLVV